jgi:hypothetical protein
MGKKAATFPGEIPEKCTICPARALFTPSAGDIDQECCFGYAYFFKKRIPGEKRKKQKILLCKDVVADCTYVSHGRLKIWEAEKLVLEVFPGARVIIIKPARGD